MTRSEPARFLRTESTMAFQDGRLLAVVDGRLLLLAPDGWSVVGRATPPRAVALTREEAEDWCEREGWDLTLLDAVPHLS